MGRLPTSPRKSFATGRLKKAKPIVAPRGARLMTFLPWKNTQKADDGECRRDWDRLDNGHPIEPVHEVHQIDEPQGGNGH
jgi:hypothetical protein